MLHKTHRTHLQHAPQRSAGGDGDARHHVEQALGFFVDQGAQANMVVVADFAKANRIGAGLLAAHQLPRFARVLVGTHAVNREFLTQKFGLEFKVLLG